MSETYDEIMKINKRLETSCVDCEHCIETFSPFKKEIFPYHCTINKFDMFDLRLCSSFKKSEK